MEGKQYSQKYRVDYSDIEKNNCMKPAAVVDRFQSLAMAHSNDIGYDLKWFDREDMGWILLYWHVQMRRLPEEGEKLQINTWTKPYKRAQAQRDFDAVDEKGEQIIYAASRWVLMNTIKRRPAKMPDEFFDAYVYDDCRPLSDENFEMPVPEEENLTAEREIIMTRRDTDTNGHANNLVYVEWAFDDVSDELYEKGTAVDLRVMYKKECRRGSTIVSYLYVTEFPDESGSGNAGGSTDSSNTDSSAGSSDAGGSTGSSDVGGSTDSSDAGGSAGSSDAGGSTDSSDVGGSVGSGKKRVRTDSVFLDPENPKKPYAQVSTIWEL